MANIAKIPMSALGRFLPVGILSGQRQLSGAKKTFQGILGSRILLLNHGILMEWFQCPDSSVPGRCAGPPPGLLAPFPYGLRWY